MIARARTVRKLLVVMMMMIESWQQQVDIEGKSWIFSTF